MTNQENCGPTTNELVNSNSNSNTIPLSSSLPTNDTSSTIICTSKTHQLSKFYKWCPHDDYLLIKGVEKGMSAEEIRGSIKFERSFTTEEITERWLSILYDPTISQITGKHMNMLQSVKNYKRVPWSNEENQIIFKEAETHKEVPLNFELIYDKYRDCLHPSRCPKTLEAHYQRMRRKGIIKEHISSVTETQPIQTPTAVGSTMDDEDEDYDETKTFSELEKEVLNAPIPNDLEMRAQNIQLIENKVSEKNELKKIHKLEKENDIDEQATGTKKIKLSFEENVIAVFDGIQSKQNIYKSESIIGRKNSSFNVDVDLSIESEDIGKISRKQAVLTLSYTIEEKPAVKTIIATGESGEKIDRVADVEDLSGTIDESSNKRVVFTFKLQNEVESLFLKSLQKV
ncbi:predicted protein [Naegleria gruberi]|uniref:Predicted protein n=1 Tax=Naegleria gruberi TaxID=5762 RepID=D2VUW0_NAEGR|nr:uncharacterized protein NAEGRDRAFT_52439 [Naegleria gruberi]EFC39334.1 predicted protein [Naegleria gruberi]|eukprot:XP_002672078.1 predicted protein [Naegleria gruberi strain NEG-M]